MSKQFNPCELCGARECVDNKCKLKNIVKKLKQENEELKKQLMQKDEVNAFFNTLDWNSDPCKICPQKNCLDEIEEIVNKYDIVNPNTIISYPLGELCQILQLIKQAKEGK